MITTVIMAFVQICSFVIDYKITSFATTKESIFSNTSEESWSVEDVECMEVFPDIYEEYLSEQDGFYTLESIPLEKSIQRHIYDECKLHDVPYELALAVCTVETGGTYNVKLRSKTNDTGLFQINDVHKKWLRESGITDLYDPYQNATAGIWILKDALSKGSDIHTSLMVYNMGYGGAKKNWKNGYYCSRYSRKVVDVMKNLESIANQKP